MMLALLGFADWVEWLQWLLPIQKSRRWEREGESEHFERIPADADHARSALCCTGQRVGRIAAVTGGERLIKSG